MLLNKMTTRIIFMSDVGIAESSTALMVINILGMVMTMGMDLTLGLLLLFIGEFSRNLVCGASFIVSRSYPRLESTNFARLWVGFRRFLGA